MTKWLCKCGEVYEKKYQAKLCHFDYVSISDEEAAQQNAHPTPETQATSQAVVNAETLSQSDGESSPAHARVA